MPRTDIAEVGAGHSLTKVLLVFLVASAGYLYIFPQANVFYAGVVLLHVVAGVAATILLVAYCYRVLRRAGVLARIGWLFVIVGAIIGIVLIKTGTPRAEWKWLYAHIAISLIGAAILFAEWVGGRGWSSPRFGGAMARVAIVLMVVAGICAGAWYLRESRWQNSARIENPREPPAEMAEEGDGSNGAFFPSSAQVLGGQKIPSEYFTESDSCQRCHQDIYQQWFSSMHHFSSFNNQWYRKSIEYMQDTIGTKPSKWCGGCHDPAVLYSGKMDTPIRQIVHTPAAQAGLGCMMCHSIARVKSTMGQADFYLEYPRLHQLAASKNPIVRSLHDFLVKLNPEPHRRVFLKPFMRDQTAEFCSSCHKVHLDSPVNHYRWLRGFNEYDNWQASGVSGQGARSFYYPPKSAQCADCHMPLTRSADMGNISGYVHSHRFPGANTAVPTANEDATQLEITEDFLKSNKLTVDIFGITPESQEMKASGANQSDLSTSFAVGEEAESKIPPAPEGEAEPVTAPLNRVQAVVRRGDTVRVEVVVRTKAVGHFFPGGTVDAFDTWLELKATDDKGQTIFWSGMVESDGKGPVDKGAHFYRSLQIDEHGNPINKRNAWSTRALVYVHLIPPGAADTVHYRLHIPENTGNRITLHARLCYRKFSWWNTQFAFAGMPDPNSDAAVTPSYDDRRFVFTAPLGGVSAKEETIPDVPIIVVAENEVALGVAPHDAPPLQPQQVLNVDEWQRWNDYGIGLFLQGNLKEAAAAFQKITEMAPNNPDGWVNIGRCAVQEGDMARARLVLEKALAISPNLARAHYFYARVLRSEGDYDGAARNLHQVLAQYPRDRVALNDLGRILFLQRKYSEAVTTLQSVLAIDPEDLQAHYDLMLAYRGLGDNKMASEHEERYLRFKADESSQAITGSYRQLHPDDNNERQAVHEHVSVPLNARTRSAIARFGAAAQRHAALSSSGRQVEQSPGTITSRYGADN